MKEFLLILILLLTGGCANTFHVRVERAIDAPDSRLQVTSNYGQKIVACMGTLGTIRLAYQSLEPELRHLIVEAKRSADTSTNSGVSIELVRPIYRAIEPLQQDLAHLQKQRILIHEHLEKLQLLFETNTTDNLSFAVQSALVQTVSFLAAEDAWLEGFSSRLSTVVRLLPSEGDNLAFSVTKSQRIVSDTRRTAESTSIVVAKDGFGGLRNLGVYELDPSDETYKTLLSEVKTKLSWESLSLNSSTAYGDSSVMVVEETPAQFRTYQLSNKPEQLLQNLSSMVSKATAAAAKYLTGVPVQ